MNYMLPLGRVALGILLVQVAACGADPATEEAASEPAAVEAPDDAPARNAAAAPQPDAPFALTVADVAAYERGLGREIEVVRSAERRLASASDDDETLDILGEIQPVLLRGEGAGAAGVPEERYARITFAVNDVLGKLEMAAAMQGMTPSEEEIAAMPPELRARLDESLRELNAALDEPYAGLAPETAQALRARVEELSQLRAEYIGALARIAQQPR